MSRLALATVAATFLLILAGGLVTNTGAGLAVPDWPTTFGHNMFLFPWSGMVGGVFYEHGHRLIGSVVGVLTVALAVALWRRGPRLRSLGIVAVVLVVVQGVLGGLRVVLLDDALAIVHGALAQAFFGLLVAIALLTGGATRSMALEPRLRAMVIVAAGLVYLQVVFGTLLTHDGWLKRHVAGAVAVYAVVPAVALGLRRTADPLTARAAHGLLVLLALQLLLGGGSFLARFSSLALPGGQVTVLLLPVAHRLVASLVLGAVVVLVMRTTGAAVRRSGADLRLEGASAR